MSSSSDSEMDENTKMLLASVDKNFISDKMYKEKTKDDSPSPVKNLKSNRYIENVEEVFHSDINIPPSMQKYVGKKFSEMVSNQVEFVDIEPSKRSKKQKTEDIPVFLLKGAPPLDLNKDSLPDLPQMLNKPLNIKKRLIEPESASEMEKLESALVEPGMIFSGAMTKNWKSRQKPKIYEYKIKNNIGYLREPTNEWTHLRKKNNWDESKIKEFRRRL